MKKLTALIIISLTLLGYGNAFANKIDEKHGYWWYEDIKSKKSSEVQEKHTKPNVPSSSQMMKMHPDDLQKLLDEQRKYAVYTLKEEDVVKYYKIQDAVRRKSAAFTSLSQVAMLDNPDLNGNAAYPVTNAARNVYKQQNTKLIEKKIASRKNKYAFGFMTKQGCPYCEIMRQTMSYFKDKYSWRIQEFDIESMPEIAARFNVLVTPTLILIEKHTKRWMAVSIGSDALSTIEQNTYRAIRQLEGSVNKQQYLTSEDSQGGFFDPMASIRVGGGNE